MKISGFSRTVIGKTAFFMGCILFLSLFVTSATGAVHTVSNGYYYSTEEQIWEMNAKKTASEEGVRIVRRVIGGSYGPFTSEDGSGPAIVVPDDGSNLLWTLWDAGRIVARSEHADAGNESAWAAFSYGIASYGDDGFDVLPMDGSFIFPQDNVPYQYLYTMRCELREGLPESDGFAAAHRYVHLLWKIRYLLWGILVLSLAAAVLCFVSLMAAAGREPGSERLVKGPLFPVPSDVLLCAAGLLCAASFLLIDAAGSFIWPVCVLFSANILLGVLMSYAVRWKAGTLWKNTVIYRILHVFAILVRLIVRLIGKAGALLVTLIRGIPLVRKTLLVFLCIALLEFVPLWVGRWEPDISFFTWGLEKMLLLPCVLYIALQLRRLARGGEMLAAGNMNYKTDTHGMPYDLKKHGENLNSIAGGMSAAVEEKIRSERMKTELITNVSHDIKTPLTSIVNYASLIGKEPCENEKIREYADVLVRQSVRLKRLIEDLVEATRAQTGNLDVQLMPCDAGTFLTQAAGEYEDRFRNAGLTPVIHQGEEPVRIMADGRRMWRIFDNLLSNMCKYALRSTRIFLSLESDGKYAYFTFRNTSREILGVPAQLLTERFVRGDTSRTTEGSGLGLSIAKSMAELMGGRMLVTVDGDLFKVILAFPLTEQ